MTIVSRAVRNLKEAVLGIDAETKEAAKGGVMFYTKLTLDLAVARTNEEHTIEGDVIIVESINGTLDVKLNTKDTEHTIPLHKHARVSSVFYSLYFTNAAQTGKTAILFIGKGVRFDADTFAGLSTTPTIYNVTMTASGTEYSQTLKDNTKKFLLHTRDGNAFRIAFVTGKVATPTAPYFTIATDEDYYEDHIQTAELTLYFGCATSGKIIEIIEWT